jgi:hypothetical protein
VGGHRGSSQLEDFGSALDALLVSSGARLTAWPRPVSLLTPRTGVVGSANHTFDVTPPLLQVLVSILPVNGQLLVSAFGPRQSERWSSALDGHVVEIPSGRIVSSSSSIRIA